MDLMDFKDFAEEMEHLGWEPFTGPRSIAGDFHCGDGTIIRSDPNGEGRIMRLIKYVDMKLVKSSHIHNVIDVRKFLGVWHTLWMDGEAYRSPCYGRINEGACDNCDWRATRP